MRTVYMTAWFKTEQEAKEFQKNEHSGALYKGTPRSRTKQDHMIAAFMHGFDPEKYPFSVNWNEAVA